MIFALQTFKEDDLEIVKQLLPDKVIEKLKL
jgi:hypothetical protein